MRLSAQLHVTGACIVVAASRGVESVEFGEITREDVPTKWFPYEELRKRLCPMVPAPMGMRFLNQQRETNFRIRYPEWPAHKPIPSRVNPLSPQRQATLGARAYVTKILGYNPLWRRQGKGDQKQIQLTRVPDLEERRVGPRDPHAIATPDDLREAAEALEYLHGEVERYTRLIAEYRERYPHETRNGSSVSSIQT